MRYAIIENEEFALLKLREYIKRLRPDYKLVFTGESVEECVEYFSHQPELDLIFMDIELTDANCFRIFEQVDVQIPVIFTTAYSEFAVQAFQVNSVDYLLKPVSYDHLERALLKYERLNEPRQTDYRQLAAQMLPKRGPRQRILTCTGDNYTPLDVKDIAFLTREDRYVFAVLKDGRRRMTDFQNLSEVADELDADRFFVISRNMITNIDAIRKVSKWFGGRLNVHIGHGSDETTVLVSFARRKEFLDWLSGRI